MTKEQIKALDDEIDRRKTIYNRAMVYGDEFESGYMFCLYSGLRKAKAIIEGKQSK